MCVNVSDNTTMSATVDLLDLLDSESSESATQASSEGEPTKSSKASESSRVDSEEKPVDSDYYMSTTPNRKITDRLSACLPLLPATPH